jgi:SAM-dependent methyltransferase
MPINDEAAARSGEQVGFSFGENWQRYLDDVDDAQLQQARDSLAVSFAGADFGGHSFLDLGCGSGVFSLAARQLGASVVSVDVDPASVACAQRLRGDDPDWSVREQSILAPEGLPSASRVYSWGVLHHTGAMWEAVRNALALVESGGLACIALYNTPNHVRIHLALKRAYNRLGPRARRLMVRAYGFAWLGLRTVVRRGNPFSYVRRYGENARGMSFWRDVEDWLGGLPFEYVEPEEFASSLPSGYELVEVIVRPPGACNEYLVRRTA